ncbi:hypothetical protein [Streptomyces fagopyri]|uniref:hypothetical protein n=1 Tax=Streptomyces fagopyri TaxID=2662397 RepID=UPI00371D9282
MTSVLRMERLRCEDPQDSLTDEIMIQANGRQVWPPSGSFSLSTGTEVPMRVDVSFDGEVNVQLFDEEDIGPDDRLNGVIISEGDTNGPRTFDITGPDWHYILTYRVKSLEF